MIILSHLLMPSHLNIAFLFSAFEAYDHFVTFMNFMNNDEQLLLHIMLNNQHYTTL